MFYLNFWNDVEALLKICRPLCVRKGDDVFCCVVSLVIYELAFVLAALRNGHQLIFVRLLERTGLILCLCLTFYEPLETLFFDLPIHVCVHIFVQACPAEALCDQLAVKFCS